MSNEGQPLFSFIVPVYNVAPYIDRCVNSILGQDLCNFEAIFVDDGSNDGSGDALDKLCACDQRAIVVHQANAGVSSARNAGLDRARGKYILFIDGDDFIEPDYAGYFLSLLEETGCDYAADLNQYQVDAVEQVAHDERDVWSDLKAIENIYLGNINVAVWNKAFRRDVIERNGLRFHPDIWYGEGMLFNIEYLQAVNSAAIGRRRVYHQVFNPNSAMRKFSLKSNLCGIRSLEAQKSLWRKSNARIERAWKWHRRAFNESIISGLVSIDAVEENRSLFDECRRALHRGMLLPWLVDIPLGLKLRQTLFAIIPMAIAEHRRGKTAAAAQKQREQLRGGRS